MRELSIGKSTVNTEESALHCEYLILIEEIGERFPCETYGVKIVLTERAEEAQILGITLNAAAIFDLAQSLCNGSVTPCTLRDIIDDWL